MRYRVPIATLLGGVVVGFDASSGVAKTVTGSGELSGLMGPGFGGRAFAFSAQVLADGSVVREWERVNHIFERFTKSHGVITCVTIIGNQAWLGGFATSGAFSTPPNNGVAWRVVDKAAGAGGPPDQISLQFVGDEVPPWFAEHYCATTPEDPPLIDIDGGDIQIH